MNEDVNIKRQVRLCNEAMLNTLIKFKDANLDDTQIKMMLGCIGKLFCQCEIDNHSIDYYVDHLMKSLENCEY